MAEGTGAAEKEKQSVENAQSVPITWDSASGLPLLFSDHMSMVVANDTFFLVFGQTLLSPNPAGGSVPSVEPIARLAIPAAVASRIAEILNRAVSDFK